MLRIQTLLALMLATPAATQEGWFDEGSERVTVPMRLAGRGPFAGVPLMEVQLGDHTAWFMADTGFNAVAVDAGIARKWGLEQRGFDVAIAIGGANRTPLFRTPEFVVGAARFETGVAHGLNLGGFSRGQGVEIAGILGGSFFGAFTTTLDYPARTITLCDPEAFVPPEGAVELSISGALGQPFVGVSIDGSPEYLFLLDTGAAPSALLYGAFAERRGVLQASGELPSVRVSGFAGTVESGFGRLPPLRLGGHEVVGLPALVLRPSDKFGMESNALHAGILGTGWLESYRVTFDYPRRKVYLEPSAAAPLSPWPVGFEESDGGLQVAMTQSDLEDALELEVGDRIVAIAGEAAPGTVPELRDVLRSMTRANLTIERDGERREVTMQRLQLPGLRVVEAW